MAPFVMVVDDDPIIRHILRTLLEMEGLRVVEAGDGEEALEMIAVERPDVLVLDVMMPNMDGITACKRLRAQAETADLPIVILSGKAQQGAAEEGLAAGANVYLKKPLDVPNLLQVIRQLLGA